VDYFPTSDMPHFVVVDDINGYWYCSLISSGYVIKFDLETDEMVDSVFIGNQPALMAIDKNTQRLYISRFMPMPGMMATNSSEVHKVDARTMTVLSTVNVGASSPHGIALSSDGQTLWIVSNQASHLFKIETSEFGNSNYQPPNYRLGSDVPFDFTINDGIYAPLEIELSPDESKVYISCSNANEVLEFDADSGSLLRSFEVGMTPWHLHFNEDGSVLFVANRMGNSISKINMEDGIVTTNNPGEYTIMHGCVMDIENNQVLVSSSGDDALLFLNPDNLSLLKSIKFESDALPTGIAIAYE